MHYIFIDTNVFLDFYRTSNNDTSPKKLDEILKKVKSNSDKYYFYITDNLKDEFYRNREKVLKEQHDNFNKDLKLTGISTPTIIRSLESYDTFNEILNGLERKKQELLKDFISKSKNHIFAQDLFMEDFFKLNEMHFFTQNEKNLARDRYDFGYPPGKNKTYGDALHWLHLLDKVPKGESLYFVTKDNDFTNPLDTNELNPFLLQEWKRHEKGDLYLLTSFHSLLHKIDEKDKEIEKEYITEIIESLVESGSFSTTHAYISKLKPYANKMDKEQIILFLKGFYSNQQINWISSDKAIKEFLNLLIKNPNYSLESRLTIKSEYYNNDNDFPDDQM